MNQIVYNGILKLNYSKAIFLNSFLFSCLNTFSNITCFLKKFLKFY